MDTTSGEPLKTATHCRFEITTNHVALAQYGGQYRNDRWNLDPREEARIDFAREVAECRAERETAIPF